MMEISPSQMDQKQTEPVLQVQRLVLKIPTYEGIASILHGVDLTIYEKEVVGLVGETGSGKTMTAMAIAGLINSPPAILEAKEISFKGENLLLKSSQQMREIRAGHIAMVFQDPTSNLNPVLSIGDQMVDAILCRNGHGSLFEFSPIGSVMPLGRKHRQQARETAVAMLKRVGIDQAEKRLHSYPHEFSGGMKQRTLIAMALAGTPELLIADEPTTALDVSIEAQILELVRDLVNELALSVIWVTHNLGVVWKLCSDVAVMYAGAVVERSKTQELFSNPKHPYTMGLLKAIPTGHKKQGRLISIPGSPPNPILKLSGCKFHPRCPYKESICVQEEPALREVFPGQWVACHMFGSKIPVI
jgi:peptide/nickel transport system ATP-binding protein